MWRTFQGNKDKLVMQFIADSVKTAIDRKVIGIINGHSYYDEIHICDFIVLEEYRKQHIGTMLIKKVEELYKNEDFDNFNLTTFEFQAPGFYEKMGYKLEYIRKNNKNPKLNKYFYSKQKKIIGIKKI